MQLVVFGANGPTGRLAVSRALAADHAVTAVARRPDRYPLCDPGLRVVGADVTDPVAVDRAVAGAEAVISTYGVPYGLDEVTVYSVGARHILAAMEEHDVRRLVCVTSTTVAPGDAPGEPWWWRRGVIPLLREVVGRMVYDDMQRMEEIVRSSRLDWTIVRPAGLFDADETSGEAVVAARRLPGRSTSRADLAALLVAEATVPRHLRETVEVVTPSGPPKPLRTFAREVFGLGARSGRGFAHSGGIPAGRSQLASLTNQ